MARVSSHIDDPTRLGAEDDHASEQDPSRIALRPGAPRPAPVVLRGLDAAVRRVERVTTLAVVAVIIGMMLLIAADVVLRYTFSRPIPWLYDLISIYLLKFVLYFMVSDVLAKGDHIALDYKLAFLPPAILRTLMIVGWIALAATLTVTFLTVAGSARDSFVQGEVMPGLYEWRVWIEKAIVAIGLAMLALRTWVIAAGHVLGTPIGIADRDLTHGGPR